MDQSAVQQFQSLPAPVKAVVLLTSGVGLLGAVQLISGDAAVVGIVAAGIVAVVGLLIAYKFLLGWLRKRKAAPMERAIIDNSSASPHAISEPARRARLDDLRKSFETGVEKFRAAGKNLYSLPWYLLVGEPGSGKTEAVRHCNVGFPPGLQDQLQGAGGTLNMNWWFTNQAIILDTAGRLMFEDVPPGSTSEWTEFLKMLLRIRPTCPINGMLLVLPADSLLRDKADEIEKKGGKIAQQLDSIQRALGVRFPVFVIITKADLITGFREYFDNLNDPQLQHQILGWSNPAPLDQPFTPDAVDNHVRSVAHKLARRRQGLLLDPVHTEDPSGRRLDQVDALYAFPESLLQIVPRLRRYLEMIFVAGEWSPKPLFLRGIYFTSSMREGTDIDVEVAKILNVAPEALPGGGKVWERDRAYFLRDLFVNKVFREKGLVTRASDTATLQRRRKLAVMGAAFASVLILFGLTWWGQRQLDQRVGTERTYWATIDREYRDAPSGKWAIVSPRLDLQGPVSLFRYDGDEKTRLPGAAPRAQIHPQVAEKLKDPIRVPRIFSLFRLIQGDVEQVRRQAGRSLFEASLLHPLLNAVRSRLDGDRDGDRWTSRATEAMAQLIRLEAYAAGAAPAAPAATSESPLHLDPLLRYVLDDEDYNGQAAAHQQVLQDSFNALYVQLGGGWPPRSLAATPRSLDHLQKDVAAFSTYWKRQIEGRSPRLAAVASLADALDAFRMAEDNLDRATKAAPLTVADFKSLEATWKTQYTALDQAKRAADRELSLLEEGSKSWQSSADALTLFQAEVAEVIESARSAHQLLLGQFPAADAAGKGGAAASRLETLRQSVQKSLTEIPKAQDVVAAHALKQRLPLLDRYYLSRGEGADRAQHRRYVIHFGVYEQAHTIVTAAPPPDATWALHTFESNIRRIDSEAAAAIGHIDPVPLRLPDPERAQIARATTKTMIDLASRHRRRQAIELTLAQAPRDKDALARAIEEVSAADDAFYHGPVPFTAMNERRMFQAAYRPETAAEFLRGWKAMDHLLAPPQEGAQPKVIDPAGLADTYQRCASTASEYTNDYLTYWTKTLADNVTLNTTWKGFMESAPRVQVHAIMAELLKLSVRSRFALQEAQKSLPRKTAESFARALSAAQPPEGPALAVLQNKCELVFAAWRQLNHDPVRARQQLIRLTPEDYLTRHNIVSAEGSASVVDHYWASFGPRLTAAVAADARDAAELALKELRESSRFPLALPKDNEISLSVDDVERVRARVGEIAVAGADAPASPAAPPAALTIRQGGLTQLDEVNKVLRRLVGLDLVESDQRLLTRTALLLDALPRRGQQFSCTVSIVGADSRKQLKLEHNLPPGNETWLQLALFQGDQQQGIEIADRNGTVTIGRAVYPGPPVQFRAKRFVAANAPFAASWAPVAARGADTAWSVLRLIHAPGARPADSAGRQWHVPVPLEDQGKGMVIWVQLDLEKPLPLPREWPGAAGR